MNSTVLLVGSIVLVLLVTVVWARSRAARIRAEAEARERRAIAAVRAGDDPVEAADTPAKPREPTGETIFEPGTPTSMVPGNRGSIEVAEVLDIEELLRGEDQGVASRARAQLEEHTNISMGDTLPPRPVLRAPAAVVSPPVRPAAAPMRAPAEASAQAAQAPALAAANVEFAAARSAQALPARPPQPAHAMAGNGAKPAAPRQAERTPAAAVTAPSSSALSPASTSASPAARAPARAASLPSTPASPDGEVPLRELVLAWFEARGYRSAPASPVVRPIELVLRHKDDPSRAYAFVVGTQRVTAERVHQLAQQARGIGLIRVLIVADAGVTGDAPNAKRGVRVLDRPALSAELAKLDISVAAKIIAVARKRAGARASAN